MDHDPLDCGRSGRCRERDRSGGYLTGRRFRSSGQALIRHPFQTDIDTTTRDALRAQFGVGPAEYLVGTVACLKPQKAPEDFVAVATQVCKAVPNARFVLIGDGDLRPRIESLIEANGLQKRLHLAGWRRDIPTVMKVFDAFLLTSHWEGLPRVLLEARTIGLPIVATRVGGVEEVIVQGRHGWLSNAGDIAGLSAHAHPSVEESRWSIPQDVPQSVEALPKEFHLEEMVKQYESLYDRFLDDSARWKGSSFSLVSVSLIAQGAVVNVPLLDLKAQYRVIKAGSDVGHRGCLRRAGVCARTSRLGFRGSNGTVYRQPLCDRLRLRERCVVALPHGDGREGRR